MVSEDVNLFFLKGTSAKMEASMKPKPALKKSRKEMRKKENKEDEEKKYKELKHVCRKGGGNIKGILKHFPKEK